MASLLHLTREIKRKLDENQQDEAFIEVEREAYEKRIADAKKRIASRNNRIQKLEDHEFFVNVSDVMTECALEWGCQVKDLDVSAQIDRRFNLNTKESTVLASLSPLNLIVIDVKFNKQLLHIRAFVREEDVHADGKTLQDKLFVIEVCDYKLVFCEKPEKIIFRYRLSNIINVRDGKIEYRSENDKIISRAIRRKEEREAEDAADIK